MSDGNFNRSLLPHTPYASGMKAGKRIARMKAVELLSEQIDKFAPDITDDEKQQLMADFDHKLAMALT